MSYGSGDRKRGDRARGPSLEEEWGDSRARAGARSSPSAHLPPHSSPHVVELHQPSAEGAGHPLAVTVEARASDLVVDTGVEERLVAGPEADPRLPRSQRLLTLAEGLEALA